MAIYKIFPSKDSTIYSNKPTINAGIDEILEIGSINNRQFSGLTTGDDNIKRAVLQFSDADIATLKTLRSGSAFEIGLKMYLAGATSLPLDYTIECYPLSQSWDMGTGRFLDDPNPKNGISWFTRGAYLENLLWSTGAGQQSYLYTTGGGTWNSSFSASQSFNYISNKDINMNVTQIVDQWFSGSIPNNGLILKMTGSLELYPSSSLEAKFFSVDTHTIYPPCLELRWNDTVYNTGSTSNTTVTTDSFILLAENNIGEYKQDTKYRMKIRARDRFPARNFTTSSEYLTWKYLPQQSYWSVQDYRTNEPIIDFNSTYTKLSADTNSNYFTLYTNGLQPERYYKLVIKVVLESTGEELIIDNDLIFKITR